MQLQIHIGQRNTRATSNHWVEINKPIELYSQPTVLFLAGANTDSRGVNGALKLIGQHFDKEDVRLLGCFYGQHEAFAYREQIQHQTHLLSDMKESAYQPLHLTHVQTFFNTHFLSLISDSDGKKLSVEECCRRVQNLTLIGHCYGSLVAYELDRLLHDKLKELSYSSAEIKQIHQSFNIINVASRAPIGKAKSQVLHILSLTDNFWLEDWQSGSANDFIYQLSNNQACGKDAYTDNLFFQPSANETLIAIPRICKETLIKDHLISLYLQKSEEEPLTPNAQKVLAFVFSFIKTRAQNHSKNIQTLLTENLSLMEELKKGAVCFKNAFHKYKLFCIAGRTLLHKAVRENNLKLAEKLLSQPYIPKHLKDSNGHFAFYYAVQNKSLDLLNAFFKHTPFFNIINLYEQGAPLWEKILHSPDVHFTHAFLTNICLKNSHYQQNNILPILKEYCLSHIGNRNCTAVLPFVIQGTSFSDLESIVRLYNTALNSSSHVAKTNRKTLLNMVKKLAASKQYYTVGENSTILLLKRLNAPKIFIDIFHHYRKKCLIAYQKNLSKDIYRFLIHGAISKKTSLPFLSLLPEQQKIKEAAYLYKVENFIFWGNNGKTAQVAARLAKRYEHLMLKLLIQAEKERS